MTGGIAYFDYPSKPARATVVRDFPGRPQRRLMSIARAIVWESETATAADMRQEEIRCIRALQANDPDIDYNRFPVCGTPGARISY